MRLQGRYRIGATPSIQNRTKQSMRALLLRRWLKFGRTFRGGAIMQRTAIAATLLSFALVGSASAQGIATSPISGAAAGAAAGAARGAAAAGPVGGLVGAPVGAAAGAVAGTVGAVESMRKCGALTRPWCDGHRPDCRWLTPDTSVRTGAGASRRGSGCGSATAGARRVESTASAASWQTACSPQH